jgi:hypothetical protein
VLVWFARYFHERVPQSKLHSDVQSYHLTIKLLHHSVGKASACKIGNPAVPRVGFIFRLGLGYGFFRQCGAASLNLQRGPKR